MKYTVIDTHCHPQFPQFDADRDEVMARARASGVGMLCVGTDAVSSRKAVELSGRYEGVWASVGTHPNDVGNGLTAADLTDLETMSSDPLVVAIGEVGLDYFRTKGEEERGNQRAALEQFLGLAQRCGKPLIIHCRDAHDDMKRILKNDTSHAPRDTRGIIHSFNGDLDTALFYIELGFLIGLNAIVTFSETYRPMVRGLPGSTIVVETDSPYLAPNPHRGQRNEPVYVLEVAKQIAAIRNEEIAPFLDTVVRNSMAIVT